MNPTQIMRRKAAADRHDAAMERWPARQGPGFEAEMDVVLREMEALVGEMPAGTTASVEWARTLRWYGDALFDREGGAKSEALERGRRVYEAAERLHEGTHEPAEYAKLQVSIANTLQGLAGTEDRTLLEEAERRYQLALDLLSRHQPVHVPTARNLLQLVQTKLGVLRARDKLVAADPSSVASLQRALHEAAAEASVAADTGRRAVERMRARAGLPPAAGMADLEAEIQALGAQGADPGMTAMFQLILAQFRSEVESGKVTPERAAALEPILRALGKEITTAADSIQDKMARIERVKGLMGALTELARRPSHGLSEPPAGSRADTLLPLLAGFRANLYSLTVQVLRATRTSEQAQALIVRSSEEHRQLLLAGGDDAAVLRAERERLRQYAADTRTLATLPNLTLARPAFRVGAVHRSANEVFYAGGAEVEALVREACARRRLDLSTPAVGEDASTNLWRRLCAANVAVLDFTAPEPEAQAPVAYALGLACVLGLPLVVLSGATPLPFDVPVQPLVRRGPGDAEAIGLELDLALYGLPSLPPGGGLVRTARELVRRYGQAGHLPGVPTVLRELEAGLDDPDPLAVRDTVAGILRLAGTDAPQLLQPAWPASYPDPAHPRLFHVMPFRPAWSASVSAAVRAVAPDRYVRHDDVADEQIIQSLWDELSRADRVLVDLTGWNPNVLIELGFAHGLGKDTLLVAQRGAVAALFPALARLRVHEYDPAGTLEDLRGVVARWLQRG